MECAVRDSRSRRLDGAQGLLQPLLAGEGHVVETEPLDPGIAQPVVCALAKVVLSRERKGPVANLTQSLLVLVSEELVELARVSG